MFKDYREGLLRIPEYMRDSAIEWIERGVIDPDDFLAAVVANDLREAVSRADDTNSRILLEWVRFFHNFAPSACWGSLEKAKAWQAHHGFLGLADAK